MYCVEHYVFEPAIEYPADYMAPKGRDFETETQLLSHGSFSQSIEQAFQTLVGLLEEVEEAPEILVNLRVQLPQSLVEVAPDQMVRQSYHTPDYEIGMRLAVDDLGHFTCTLYSEHYGADYDGNDVIEQTNEYRVRWDQCTL